jgi:hypothetical protein
MALLQPQPIVHPIQERLVVKHQIARCASKCYVHGQLQAGCTMPAGKHSCSQAATQHARLHRADPVEQCTAAVWQSLQWPAAASTQVSSCSCASPVPLSACYNRAGRLNTHRLNTAHCRCSKHRSRQYSSDGSPASTAVIMLYD